MNHLTPDEEAAIFSILRPLQGAGEKTRYLESEADAAIGEVRRRPRETRLLSSDVEEDQDVIKQELGVRNSWAASVEPVGGKPLRNLPPVLLVGEEQAAQMLGVSRRTIFDLNKQGKLPSVMVGSRKKYSVKMLRSFADGGEV